MLFRISFLLAVCLYGSCMEMRETVERMVMVRTSGSDLQPAATGYIYKKKNDGKESVIEMGESEVMKHLAKYYEHPRSFNEQGHVAADDREGKEDGAALKQDQRVIPVSEESDEKIDGLATDDFKKILEKYGVNFDDHKNYDHYTHGLGDFKDGYYHGYGDASKENKNHHYGSGDTVDYHNKKYEGYIHAHKDGDDKEKRVSEDNKDQDDHTLDKQKESETGINTREQVGFQNSYDNDKKNRNYYDNDDGITFAYYKYGGGNKYYGDDREYRHGSRETDDFGSKIGKTDEGFGVHGTNNSAEEQVDASEGKQSDYGSEGAQTYGRNFSFKIKH